MDIEYLVRAKFQGWMQYLINTHFRMELNVSKDQPLPCIQEFQTKEEINELESFLQIDLNLQDALARDDIQFTKTNSGKQSLHSPVKALDEKEIGDTRMKLNKWFPV